MVKKYYILLFISTIFSTLYSQVSGLNGVVKSSFALSEIEIKRGGIVSNVLKINNEGRKKISVNIELTLPFQWKQITNTNKTYDILGGDSIFIPLRILPDQNMLGNTQYYIECIINDIKEGVVGYESFYCTSEKIKNWEITSEEGSIFYFKNKQEAIDFNVNILNRGNEKQELFLSHKLMNVGASLLDTTGEKIENKSKDISLEPFEDSTFYYQIKLSENKRNNKVIDEENYSPTDKFNYKKYTVFITTEELLKNTITPIRKSQKLSFIRLPSVTKENKFNGNVLPLIVDLNVSNILGNSLFTNISFRGLKNFNNSSSLVYNGNLFISSSDIYSKKRNQYQFPFYIGYFSKKYDVQLGDISTNNSYFTIAGKGIKMGYYITEQHRFGAHFVMGNTFREFRESTATGFSYSYTSRAFNNKLGYNYLENKQFGYLSHFVSVEPKFKLNSKHSFSLNSAINLNVPYAPISNNYLNGNGYVLGAGYNAKLFANVWGFSLRGNYQEGNLFTSYFNRMNGSHRSKLKMNKKYYLNIINNINTYERFLPDTLLQQRLTSSNVINLSSTNKKVNVQPGLFYTINTFDTVVFHNRGFSFSISEYNFDKNLQVSYSNNIGLSRLVNQSFKEYFNLLNSLYVRFKTINFTLFYRIGPNSPTTIYATDLTDKTPQDLRMSLGHQYQFKNKVFIARNNFSYYYTNMNKRHSFNYTPTFNFYTYTGWRFQIRASINYNSTTYEQIIGDGTPEYLRGRDLSKSKNTSASFSLGVRKEFGVPIPGKGNKYHNATFKAFYDINGNGVFDKNEQSINNVVISYGDKQVITNEFGVAVIQNVNPELKQFIAMSLEDLKGWFPLIDDSIAVLESEEVMVPFVKGIKVIGRINLDREKLMKAGQEEIALWGIRITAISETFTESALTGNNGTFEMYLPFGEYTLSMDEKVLGSQFSLVKNNYNLDLNAKMDNIYVSFVIKERRRKIKVKKFGSKK